MISIMNRPNNICHSHVVRSKLTIYISLDVSIKDSTFSVACAQEITNMHITNCPEITRNRDERYIECCNLSNITKRYISRRDWIVKIDLVNASSAKAPLTHVVFSTRVIFP